MHVFIKQKSGNSSHSSVKVDKTDINQCSRLQSPGQKGSEEKDTYHTSLGDLSLLPNTCDNGMREPSPQCRPLISVHVPTHIYMCPPHVPTHTHSVHVYIYMPTHIHTVYTYTCAHTYTVHTHKHTTTIIIIITFKKRLSPR